MRNMRLHRKMIFQKQSGPLPDLRTHHGQVCSFFIVPGSEYLVWSVGIQSSAAPHWGLWIFLQLSLTVWRQSAQPFMPVSHCLCLGHLLKVHNSPWTQGGVLTPCTGASLIHHIPYSVTSISIFQILPVGNKILLAHYMWWCISTLKNSMNRTLLSGLPRQQEYGTCNEPWLYSWWKAECSHG